MIPHQRLGKRGFSTAATAFLLAAVFMIAGCAGTSGGNQQSAAGDDPAAQCRAAIAAVNERCAGDGAASSACADAKTRSRNLCIPE